jgi:hypothetical protein
MIEPSALLGEFLLGPKSGPRDQNAQQRNIKGPQRHVAKPTGAQISTVVISNLASRRSLRFGRDDRGLGEMTEVFR